jgi:broad specificity phosphatase PhoE
MWRGPERRAAETADLLGRVAEPCADLRAWSAGEWSGQSVTSIAERDPEGFRAWRTDPEARPNGGESLRMLLDRVADWLERQAQTQGRSLAIADPAIIRAAVVHVLDAPPHTFWHLDVAPLSLTTVQYAQGAWRLRSLGVVNGGESDA